MCSAHHAYPGSLAARSPRLRGTPLCLDRFETINDRSLPVPKGGLSVINITFTFHNNLIPKKQPNVESLNPMDPMAQWSNGPMA